MLWHCGAAHRWKGAAGGNFFRVDLRRQMKCDVPTPRETLHPQHLQAQEFRRQWGQTHGLQATMHIWQSCERQPAQLQNLPRLLSVTSIMQHLVWTTEEVRHPRPCIFQQTIYIYIYIRVALSQWGKTKSDHFNCATLRSGSNHNKR